MSSVKTFHNEYLLKSIIWLKIRDLIDGEEKVKSKGEIYLPKPNKKWSKEKYEAYLARAVFFNALNRTIQGLSGMVFRKSPVVNTPDAFNYITIDCDMSGRSLLTMAQHVINEVLSLGRHGILVDYSGDTTGMTVSEIKSSGARAKILTYNAEDIINWRKSKGRFTLIVLRENIEEESSLDIFSTTKSTVYRVLNLDSNGFYNIRTFKETDGNTVEEGEPKYVKIKGKNMKYIPFFGINQDGSDFSQCCEPTMNDLANLSLAHYRTDADKRNTDHLLACPTLFIKGYGEDDDSDGGLIAYGPDKPIVLKNTDADAKFLEISEKGSLRTSLQDLEEKMAAFGARFLSSEKKGAEAPETEMIRRQGEMSILGNIAFLVSMAITQALKVAAEFDGFSDSDVDDIKFELNNNFMPTSIDPALLTAMADLVATGMFSKKDFFWNLQHAELVQPDVTYDQYIASIENDGIV